MSFHLYRINELYSNADGSIQFIEMKVGNFSGESQWNGITLTVTRSGVMHTFSFPSNLPSGSTANTSVLIATQAFADLGVVTPDFIVPAGFLFPAGGTVNFGGVDSVTYGALPTNGAQSVGRSGELATASPTNFAGTTGSLPPTPELLIINGTAGDDTLTGTLNAETINGLAGNDTIKSGGGNDTLNGGAGDDFVFSGAGNDTLDGGDGYDYLYFTEATAGVSINLATSTATATGGAGSDTITGFELLFGSSFNDTFVGNDSSVGFLGGEGNDTITGGAGRDHLEGNGGDDTIDGRDGADVVAYYSAAGAVTVNLTTGTATGGLGNDTLLNIEDVTGSVFGDTLTGSGGDNVLEGSDGNDSFVSTAGGDTLNGGIGVDTVNYSQTRGVFTLQRSAAGVYSVEKPNSAGSDTFTNTERLKFSDTGVALDLDGHAGQAAKLLGAVFGAAAVANRQYVGICLSLLDGGMSYEQLAAAAVGVTGSTTNFAVVSLLWNNLAGFLPTAEQAAPVVALLDQGVSIGALTVWVADLSLNADNIGLVGLTQTGLEFVL